MRKDNLNEVQVFRFEMDVKNFDKMKEFYENTLQFRIIRSWNRGEKDKGLIFDTENGEIEISKYRGKYKPVQNCKISLLVKDVWKLWRKLKDHKNIVFALRDNSWGDTSFCIRDPGGLHISFFTYTKNKPK